jgi:hypothetical protein
MRLSKRGEYGLRAMIDIATWEKHTRVVQIKNIAERENIPAKYLEQILLTLKNAGPHCPGFRWPFGSDSLRQPDGLRALRLPGRENLRIAHGYAGRAQRYH